MTTTLYGSVTKDSFSEIRTYVRATGLKPPKLGRVPIPHHPLAFPLVTFEFEDDNSAFMFRMRFGTKVFNEERLAELEAVHRERINEGVKDMGLPPAMEAALRQAMIDGKMPGYQTT